MILWLLWLLLVSAAWAQPPQLPHPQAQPSRLLFSPDGRRLLMNEGSRVWLWDVENQRLLHTLKGFQQVVDATFSPDGNTLYVSDSPRWIGAFDCRSGFK